MPRMVILGAGLSGLAIASRQPSCVVLEASSRVGGWAHSVRRSEHGGHLFEVGPHSLRLRGCANSLAVLDLFERIKIEPIQAAPEAKKRLIWHHGALVAMPDSLLSALRNPVTRAVPWYYVKDILGLSPPRPQHDETVHEFVSRKFSPEVADSLVTAFVAGVYAGDASRLSSQAVFKEAVHREDCVGSAFRPSLMNLARRSLASSSRNKSSVISFTQGMSELAAVLHASLKPSCEVRLNDPVVFMRRDKHQWLVQTAAGAEHVAKTVVSTLPLAQLQAVLPAAFSPMLDACVAKLGTVDVAVVNLRYESQTPPLAFGHLVASVPEQVKTGVLGVIYDSVVFPVQQMGDRGCVVSVMMGGAHAPWVATLPADELVRRASAVMATHCGFNDAPVDALATVHFNCIPQCTPGHMQRAVFARQELGDSGCVALGTGMLGVGMVDAIGGSLRAMDWFED